jgi:hypothetical protein
MNDLLRKISALIPGLVLVVGVRAADAPKAPVLSPESQKTYQERVVPFLKKHCWECHDEKSAKAGFRVDVLGTDFLADRTADHWREAIDKVSVGKMPPKKQPRPDPAEAFAVVTWVNQELRNAEKRAQAAGGRVPMRRLNRTEYANTVRDLFHLDDDLVRKIEQELPMDGKVEGFDRGGAALFVDKSQLQAYLDVAELIVREALPAAPIKTNKYRALPSENHWLRRSHSTRTTMEDVLDRGDIQFSDLLNKEQRPLRSVERGPEPNDLNIWRDGGIELVTSSAYADGLYAGQMLQKVVTQDGWYRFRIRAGASRGNGKFAVDAVRVEADYCRQSREIRRHFSFTIDAPLDRPQVYEQTVYLRRGGKGFNPSLSFRWNIYHPFFGLHDDGGALIRSNPELRHLYWAGRSAGGRLEHVLQSKESPEVVAEARRLFDEARENIYCFALNFRGPINHLNPDIDPKDVQRLWYEYIELEGPLVEWPTTAHKEIFFKGTEAGDAEYIRQIFARFLPRAYRRPVTAEEIEPLVQLVQTMQEKHGKSFSDAVRGAVARVLVTPHFLYLQEPNPTETTARALTDDELANRLSYFLWATMPDEKLRKLAAEKQLHKPEVLRGEVARMLADRRSRQFVQNFVGQWMRVREFDSVPVDTAQYRNYDDALREAGLREPYEFFDHILRDNLPIVNVLDSDFLVVNERLAKHYGIDGVKGEEFRRVPRPPDRQRGGILGMAGLLTYLADGSRTLPVRRGVYVQEVLWNKPALLPPPNVGDLPPMVKDVKTVRQRLEKHRLNAFCASCHNTIDPLGLALENYDAIGAWRERQNGEGRKGTKYDPAIDASGIMPDGKAFKDLPEFKQLLQEENARFLKGFTEKLLAYALGRNIGTTDRELVEKVLADASKQEYRLQAMLQAVVATRAFQTR